MGNIHVGVPSFSRTRFRDYSPPANGPHGVLHTGEERDYLKWASGKAGKKDGKEDQDFRGPDPPSRWLLIRNPSSDRNAPAASEFCRRTTSFIVGDPQPPGPIGPLTIEPRQAS